MKKRYINNAQSLFFLTLLFISCSFFSVSSRAGSDTVKFNVTFSIVAKTCTINNNENITVDFDVIDIPYINGVNYEQPIIYKLNCGDNAEAENPALKFQFSGNGASFNPELLATSEKYLGIRLKQRGKDYPMNSWVSFSYKDPPDIKAVPVKYGAGGLDDGDFTASATFSVEYE